MTVAAADLIEKLERVRVTLQELSDAVDAGKKVPMDHRFVRARLDRWREAVDGLDELARKLPGVAEGV